MKTRRYILLLMAFCYCSGLLAQNGYLYIHNKTINEASAVDLTYTLKDNSNNVVGTYVLSDQPGNYTNAYDIGAGRGNGAGELWTITTASGLNPATAIGSTVSAIYRRQAGGTVWNSVSTGITGNPSAIDGAYLNQFVFILGGKVYFYNAGVSTNIYTSTDATDISAANGIVAIVAGGILKKWNGSYTTSTVTASTSWTSLTVTGSSGTIQRLDLNPTGTTILYQTSSTSSSVFTVPVAGGAVTNLGLINTSLRPGSNAAPAAFDVTWDDNGNIYSNGVTSVNGTSDIVYSYSGSTWTAEPEARGVKRISGGAGGQVWGVAYLSSSTFAGAVWARTTDGTHQWIDDERIKTSNSYRANATMISLSPGTYTLTETIPNSNWDVGRFNIYDPTGLTTVDVAAGKATINVSANNVVHVEFITELLRPKAITLVCSQSTLQSFDGGTATGQFGSATYGTEVEGTSYHYLAAPNLQDGYYTLLKGLNGFWHVTNNPDIKDHTGNGGYFMLVNAAYGRDEFYRQRITNLVPGLDYIIGFWAADALGQNPIRPNVSFGMQKLDGTIYGSASTGDIYPTTAGTNTGVWRFYSVYFTQPAGITTADLFIKNNNIGGSGNDIVIDDITLNPKIASGSPNVLPAVVCTGPFPYHYLATNPQSGGFWSSGNPSVVSIDPVSGEMTPGSVVGSATITYSVSNSVGCVSNSSSTIALTQSPDVTASSNTSFACTGQTVNLSSSVTKGTAPYIYSWYNADMTNSGLGSTNTQNTTATPITANTYKYAVTVTDNNGCKDSDTASLLVRSGIVPTVTATATPVNNSLGNVCEGQNTVNLASTPSPAGTYTFKWTGSGISASTSQNTTALPVLSGAFNVVVVNQQGCFATANTQSITVWPKPTATPASNFPSVCRQTVSLSSNASGGTSGYTYLWTSSPASGVTIITSTSINPTASFTASNTFTFNLVVTDTKGCTASGTTPVVVTNAAIAPVLGGLSATPNPVCEGASLSLSVSRTGGVSPYSFTWSGSGINSTTTTGTASPATNTATPAGSGSLSYNVFVTDGNGCSVAASAATVTVRPRPVVSLSSNAIKTCLGNTITLTAATSSTTANYTYTWTGTGITSATTAATNSVSVTNTAYPALSGSYDYTVSVSDGNGCTSASTSNTTLNVTFNSPSQISSLTVDPTSVCEGGLITLSPVISGGTMPFYYSWTGSTGSGLNANNTFNTTANPTIDANYGLLVMDNNGCSASKQTATITVYPVPVVTVTTSATVCSGNSISLQSSVTGGTGVYSSFTWSGANLGATNVQNTTAVPVASGSYSLAVTDDRGCTGSGQASVTVNPIPVVSLSKNADTVCSGSPMNAITLSSSVAGANFSWSRDNGTLTTGNVTGINASATGNIGGTPVNATSSAQPVLFSVQAQSSGCISPTTNFTLLVQPPVSAVISGNQNICAPLMPAVLTVSSSSALPLTLHLSDGSVVTMNSATNYNTVYATASTSYSITSVSSVATGCSYGGGASQATVTIVPPSGAIGYWQGSVSRDWFNACNWGSGVIPDNTIDVFISGVTPNSPFVSALSPSAPADKTARVKSITISAGQNLAFDTIGNAIMEVYGNWTDAAGSTGFVAGTGTVKFMAGVSQAVANSAGSETFYNLSIDNTSSAGNGVQMQSVVTVTDSLALNIGVINNGTNLLRLTNPSVTALTGGSMISYITGTFYRATNSTGEYFYPVGKLLAPYGNYRPSWVIPSNGNAAGYTSEYKIVPPPETIDNRFVTGILNTEYWDIERVSGNTDASIKLIYVNPKNPYHWTIESPCSSCYVGIAKPIPAYSNYWYFTDGNGSSAALSAGQITNWQTNAILGSAEISSFGSFTFAFSFNGVLAVNNIDLRAMPDGNSAMVEWQLSDPNQYSQASLEHSGDGKNFTAIYNLLPVKDDQYKHANLSPGNHYYRLKLSCTNGKNAFSKIVMISVKCYGTFASGPFPSVVAGNTAIHLFAASSQEVYIRITDNTGHIFTISKQAVLRGENTIGINTAGLINGVYNIIVNTTDGYAGHLRFVKL